MRGSKMYVQYLPASRAQVSPLGQGAHSANAEVVGRILCTEGPLLMCGSISRCVRFGGVLCIFLALDSRHDGWKWPRGRLCDVPSHVIIDSCYSPCSTIDRLHSCFLRILYDGYFQYFQTPFDVPSTSYLLPPTTYHVPRTPIYVQHHQILARRGAIVLRSAFFSSVSSISGRTPSSRILAR